MEENDCSDMAGMLLVSLLTFEYCGNQASWWLWYYFKMEYYILLL